MSDLTLLPGGGDESPFDRIKRTRPDGTEYWSARELMPMLGYEKWERFAEAVERAVAALTAQGADVEANVSRRREPIAKTMREDFHLSRFASYQVAMCGDPRKKEVASALAYFATRTREAETRHPLTGNELMAAGYTVAMRVLEERDSRIHQLEAEASANAPKVAYVNNFVADNDLLSFSTVASTCRVKESQLRELLIEKGWIYRQTERRYSESHGKVMPRNRYTEKADKKRYFRRVEVHDAPRFLGEMYHTLKITPIGAEAIARLVAKENKA